MGSKKRTVGILIVVIIVLLVFAGSLIVFRNKISSENTKSNSDVYTAVDKELYETIVTDNFKNASIEERKDIALNVLNKLENENKILKGSIKFNEEYNSYFFKYVNGGEGSIMLDNFFSSDENEGGIFDAEINNIDTSYKSSNNTDNSLNYTAKGYINSALSNNNLTYETEEKALIIDEASSDIKYEYLRNIYENCKEIWSSNGLKTTIKSNITVEEFKTILNGYDFIDINAHGYIDYDGNPTIYLQENQKKSNVFFYGLKYAEDIKFGRVGTTYGECGGNFYLTSHFFADYYKYKLSDTIIWLSCCKGYSNDTLVSTFANECSVKSIIGATDNVWIDYDTEMTDIFVHKLLLGHTVDSSLREAKSKFGKDGIDFAICKGWNLNKGPAEFKIYNGGNETLVELVSINTNGKLSGKVTDENNNPIKGAELGIHDVRGHSFVKVPITTDENGEYTLECPVGSYKIGVKANGYEVFETDDFISVDYDKETVFNITLKKETELTNNYTAVDLIYKTIPEIITLMNGEYQIIKTENDGYIYIQNQSVLSGMEFYISVSGDDIVSANNGEEIHSETLKTKLELGELALDGIQVNKSGKVSDSIQADMDYKSCSKILGDFKCNGGTGGYLGGSIETALYTYNEKNAKVILHFNMPSEIINDLRLGKIISVSAEEMKSYNPKLENVVVKKNETVTDVQTEQIESISVIPKGANTYNGHSYVVYPESMTWQEAKEYCEKLGGHLVTISDADEQKFVEDLAEKFTDKTSYWLGGYYSDSEWKWVDNTEFSYTNWDSWTDGTKEYRQPDNFYGDEYYLRFANKDFTYTDWKSNKGKWNDVSNEADGTSGDVPLNFFGLICEWDIISQNNNTETEATVSVDNVTYLEEISITESDRYTGNEGDSFVYPIGKHKNTRGNTCIDGESYEHGIECWLARWNYEYESSWAYSVFHLDKKYSILRGECHIIQSYNTTDFDVTLEFLGDNALLNSYHLTPDSMPIEIDVNISNCADLKIYIYDNEKQKGGTSFGLVDMKLQK